MGLCGCHRVGERAVSLPWCLLAAAGLRGRTLPELSPGAWPASLEASRCACPWGPASPPGEGAGGGSHLSDGARTVGAGSTARVQGGARVPALSLGPLQLPRGRAAPGNRVVLGCTH